MTKQQVRRVQLDPDLSLAHSVVWVGAASFEERCVGAVELLVSRGQVASAVLLNYTTKMRPHGRGEELRDRYRRRILAALNRGGVRPVEEREADAYSPRSLRTALNLAFEQAKHRPLLVDLTCLTRIHVAYAVTWILRAVHIGEVWVAYSVPKDYGTARELRRGPGYGWRSVVTGPLIVAPTMGRDAERAKLTYGLLLAGHEGDRARAAVSQQAFDILDLLVALTPEDPLVEDRAVVENWDLLQDVSRKTALGWRRLEKPKFDVQGTADVVSERIQEIAERGRPKVFMMPLGPKAHVLACCLAFENLTDVDVDILYPIPVGYEVHYTRGLRQVLWARIK